MNAYANMDNLVRSVGSKGKGLAYVKLVETPSVTLLMDI